MPILGVIDSAKTGNLSSYESIQTITVGSGGASTIVFSSIPSTYAHLQIRALNITTATYVDLQLNGDTGANYTYQQLEVSTPAAVTAAGASAVTQIFTSQTGGNISFPNGTIIDIYNYSSSVANKTVRLISANISSSGGLLYFRSGIWTNTNAINQLTFRAQGPTFAQNTVYALYGMKGA
jgi:hypothetical protein